MEHKIDAKNKILGRLATEVAMLLRGKKDPSFSPSNLPSIKVFVYNTDGIKVTGKKPTQKMYRHHSGYHGGLKEETFAHLLVRDSRMILKNAVMGMLPKNRLRSKFMRNLIVSKQGLAS